MTARDPEFRPRLHIILLGVSDVARSAAFYEAMGWRRAPTSHAGFVKFDLGGHALALISKVDLAKDALGSPVDAGASSAAALIYLAERAEDVAVLLDKAAEAVLGSEADSLRLALNQINQLSKEIEDELSRATGRQLDATQADARVASQGGPTNHRRNLAAPHHSTLDRNRCRTG